jgi:4a-hydroxytetrahydrobiopterin dehydratase
MTRQILSPEAIEAALTTLPGWTFHRNTIAREFLFESYEAGAGFAMQVCLVAQRIDHHPDITIGWKRVLVTFTTHDSEGITATDVRAASLVSALVKPSHPE